MEWDPNYVPPVKMVLHIAQGILIFVLWCLELAVFNADKAKIVGNNGWTFGVCFLSIPAIVYLAMTPRFARTRKFAQPHAMLAVDGFFAVVWLSAFATQASYNSAGLCGSACKISKAIVGLGVFITLLFIASAFISAYSLTYYNFHGVLPGYDSRKIKDGGENIDPDKAAFSTAPHDDDAYERVNMDDNDNFGSYTNRYGSANPYDDDDDPDRYGAMPPRNNAMFDNDTEYGGSALGTNLGSNLSSSVAPGGPTPYGSSLGTYDDDGPAQFPAASYDRIQR